MVVESRQDETNDDLFPNVAKLAPNGAAAAEKLQQVYGDLMAAGATADAERLLALDEAAARRDHASLDRMLTVEHPLDQLSELQHASPRRLAGWRNAVALTPLLMTWGFLGMATWFYHRQVQADPELATQPFIMLWQQRFGGAPVLTFAETAIFAFLMLGLVLILTVLAHRREVEANRVIGQIRTKVDGALGALALATETSGIRAPMTAEEWAAAAQRVLGETQSLIEAAVRDTRALAETNVQLVTEGREAVTALYTEGRADLGDLHAKGREFVGELAQETSVTMAAARTQNAQLITDVAEQARAVLQQAGAANRQLIEEQMSPLFEGFQESLREYRADHETYRTSSATLAGGVSELAAAARLLGESVGTYASTATSIDEHLRRIDSSQSAFVARLSENSQSMTTAASAMREATETMGGRLRADLEALAGNVVAASTRLAEVDRDLVKTGSALEVTTRALLATTTNLDRVATDLAGVAAGLAAASGRGAWWGRWIRPLGR